ncbi:MAG: hypothetical protein NW201_05870 [Gemmatimonadales bacterium]|nr:hypothetical protein [Gemmatimonadales bacterium]
MTAPSAGEAAPFTYGRELGARELVDREAELAELRAVLRGHGRHFLVGPRRFGKSSLLRAAAEGGERGGALVLRYDLQRFAGFDRLVRQLVADVARRTAGPADRALAAVKAAFRSLRPELTWDPAQGGVGVTLGVRAAADDLPLVCDALDGLDRHAERQGIPVAVVLDEVQRLVERGGTDAEGQLRAATQAHRHVAYVFAGSATRLLAAMTTEPDRPFYRLGSRRFLGPIPRDAFRKFLAKGLATVSRPAPDGIEAILDLAEDVPYDVQRLAHACWSDARARRGRPRMDAEAVRRVHGEIARTNEPLYMHLWSSLTAAQQRALLLLLDPAAVEEGLLSAGTARRARLPVSTLQRAFDALVDRQVLREELAVGGRTLKFEDPLFKGWVGLTIPGL